jgi:hypothetical protein
VSSPEQQRGFGSWGRTVAAAKGEERIMLHQHQGDTVWMSSPAEQPPNPAGAVHGPVSHASGSLFCTPHSPPQCMIYRQQPAEPLYIHSYNPCQHVPFNLLMCMQGHCGHNHLCCRDDCQDHCIWVQTLRPGPHQPGGPCLLVGCLFDSHCRLRWRAQKIWVCFLMAAAQDLLRAVCHK